MVGPRNESGVTRAGYDDARRGARARRRRSAAAVPRPLHAARWRDLSRRQFAGGAPARGPARARRSRPPAMGRAVRAGLDRKRVVAGKSVSVRVDLGVRRIIKKKTTQKIKQRVRTK